MPYVAGHRRARRRVHGRPARRCSASPPRRPPSTRCCTATPPTAGRSASSSRLGAHRRVHASASSGAPSRASPGSPTPPSTGSAGAFLGPPAAPRRLRAGPRTRRRLGPTACSPPTPTQFPVPAHPYHLALWHGFGTALAAVGRRLGRRCAALRSPARRSAPALPAHRLADRRQRLRAAPARPGTRLPPGHRLRPARLALRLPRHHPAGDAGRTARGPRHRPAVGRGPRPRALGLPAPGRRRRPHLRRRPDAASPSAAG